MHFTSNILLFLIADNLLRKLQILVGKKRFLKIVPFYPYSIANSLRKGKKYVQKWKVHDFDRIDEIVQSSSER